jgi:metal-responsive CopG/Arc/MetJ family transcriptional regulator
MHGMARPVGRPPLNIEAVTIRLRKGVSERIDRVRDKESRAEWVRTAVEMRLREIETKKAAESAKTKKLRR